MRKSRLVAFDILYSILRDNAYSNIAIDKALSAIECDNKALATRIVYGVIERRLTLDYLINQHIQQKPKPKIRIILYIGAYQLLFMDKIPDSVAVNEAVSMADSLGLGYYKALINAVLRKISDKKIDIDNIESPEVRYSCPQPLINKWTKMYGSEQTLEILEQNNKKPPIFAIPNRKFVDAQELQYELLDEGIESEIKDDVLIICSSIDLKSSRSFNNGLFYIEDLSSYLCARALDVKEDDIVLDMCSAPGGKAFTLAQSLGSSGRLYAYDLYEHRARLISEGAERLDLKCISAGVNDATAYSDKIPMADKILCDVVCSGFGIIRRKPEIRYKSLDDIKKLPELQYNILSTSSGYLKNGGLIMYSTCTLNKQENERVVERFLSEHGNFRLIEMITTFPQENAGDGFFRALMEKTDD